MKGILNMKRTEAITLKGFEEITENIVAELKTKTTKAAAYMLNRIETSEYYRVYRKENEVITYTRILLTKQEQTLIKQITGIDPLTSGKYFDKIGEWDEWINLED